MYKFFLNKWPIIIKLKQDKDNIMETIFLTIVVACISLTISAVNCDGIIVKRQLEQNPTHSKNKTQLPEKKVKPEISGNSYLFFYNNMITVNGTKRPSLGYKRFNETKNLKKNEFQRKQINKHGKMNKLKSSKQAEHKQHKVNNEQLKAHRNIKRELKNGEQIDNSQILLRIEKDALEIEHLSTLESEENFINDSVHKNLSVADALASKIRILCLILTHPKNHMTKAVHVKATWGKRCTRLIFMSTIHDVLVPTVKLPVKEGRDYLWLKVRAAFQYVYDHHRNEADWFLKADDDTYVILENLRYFLSAYNSTTPVYFGHRMFNFTQSYMQGGAGYVLSRAALDLLVKDGLPSYDICPIGDTAIEDVEMGICLENIGVKAIDPRDIYKFGRFFPHSAYQHLTKKNNDKYGCCSNYTISFHHVASKDMYVYEKLIYHIRPYGIFY